MVYLKSFAFPSRAADESYFLNNSKATLNCHITHYPFIMFRARGLPDWFEFRDITIFCGNNGSGKSTVLNVIAEMLGAERRTLFNRTDFFDDYVDLCRYRLEADLPKKRSIITSDDVFDRVLDIRRLNNGIDDRRESVMEDYINNNSPYVDSRLHGMEDYERFKSIRDARKKSVTESQYIRSRVIRNIEERSNGESALSFFVDSIREKGIYLLDEPENSLSPSNQLELKYFLEDCAKRCDCQFIISTHSPFLLSLNGAKIYDLDSVPVEIRKWSELECVRVYKRFFDENSFRF